MSSFLYLIIIFLACFTWAFGSVNPPQNLRVDYNANPLGIDNPKPGFSWEDGDLNRGAVQSAYRIIISSSMDKLNSEKGDIWDTHKVKSKQTIQVSYDGVPLKSSTRYFWKAWIWDGNDSASIASDPAWFETGLLNPMDWKGSWISDNRKPPVKAEEFYKEIPAPLFRKTFNVKKNISRARLYISGLGYYEAFLNGQKVGDHHLDPGWTKYSKTVYYAAYDITSQIMDGANAIGVVLGNGWYNPLPMRLFGRWNLREILTIGQPKVIAQLEITYADGTNDIISTDKSWRTTEGPVIRNNVYLGEWYDARLEKKGWATPEYQKNDWSVVQIAEPPQGELKWQYIPPIRHTRTVFPIRISEPEPGMYVVDMGRNFAGEIKFRVSASAGTVIKFRYAELINPDGTLDFRTTAATQIKEGGISGGPGAPPTAWQEDRYISRGGDNEIFYPQFTFHGFRYVEITGLPYRPSLNDIEGIRMNADLPGNGSFQCSNPLFNKIQKIVEWTMLSNVFSIESDCPAREKFGYGGDMVAAGETYMYNFDMSNFYQKTVRDFSRDQLASGGMTECAPNIGINGGGLTENTGPVGWTLAHPFLVEKIYKYYGNLELAKEQYPAIKDLVDFYDEHAPDHIIMVGIGDHNSVDERPTPVSSTAFFYHHVRILSELAGLLGRDEDAEKYSGLADEIKEAFIKKFVDENTGEVYTHTEAAQVFALYYDLLPENLRRKALQVLRDEIFLHHHGHVSTGIFTTKMMLEYLSDHNMDEINFTMMNQKDFPGYGYMIDNGATTLWENWDFEQHDSKNHPMFGSVSEWFHRSVLGIQQTKNSVGFSEIVIRPAVVGGLTWADGYYQSVRGRIKSSWWKLENKVIMNISIPANTKAFVYLPVAENSRPDIFEGGIRLVKEGEVEKLPEDFKFIGKTREHYIFETGSGRYHFEVTR